MANIKAALYRYCRTQTGGAVAVSTRFAKVVDGTSASKCPPGRPSWSVASSLRSQRRNVRLAKFGWISAGPDLERSGRNSLVIQVAHREVAASVDAEQWRVRRQHKRMLRALVSHHEVHLRYPRCRHRRNLCVDGAAGKVTLNATAGLTKCRCRPCLIISRRCRGLSQARGHASQGHVACWSSGCRPVNSAGDRTLVITS